MMILPGFYWIIINSRRFSETESVESRGEDFDVTIMIPMRNEISNVERKLDSIIPEIIGDDSVKLLLIESCSTDGTGQAAREFLERCELPNHRWQVRTLDIPGKSIAINRAMEEISSDIIIMTDADAMVYPGWLEIVIENLSREGIGVVSGLEEVGDSSSNFGKQYRTRSNVLREKESRNGSTTVLEGSIIAWKVQSLGEFNLDEGLNADDAQICFRSIRLGNRAIVDPRITFRDFEHEKRTFFESVRRSQGLSRVLIRNADLVFSSRKGVPRWSVLNSILTYVILPWAATVFALNALLSISYGFSIAFNWPSISLLMILLIFLFPLGRALFVGIIVSIIAHVQISLGKSHHNWEPSREPIQQ